MTRLGWVLLLFAALGCGAWGQATAAGGGAAPLPPASPPPSTTGSAGRVATAAANAPPPRPLSLSERADIMMARKEYYAAMDLLKEALLQHPRDGSLANRIGISYQLLGQPSSAAHYYERAIRSNRHLAQPYNNLGTLYYDERNYGKALKLYHHAIHLSHKKVAAFYVNAGTAEFMRRHLKNARRDYIAALRLDPLALDPTHQGGNAVQDSSVSDPARFHYFLAKLYCEVGDLADAMHQFRQSLELQYRHIARVCHDRA
ncbi:MAG: tetratricopeptide repeat protein, partial [Terriglobales bacterium]